MANAFEAAEAAGRTGAMPTPDRRELVDAPIPAIERASAKFEATRNTEALLEKIKNLGKLDLLTNFAPGYAPGSQSSGAKLNKVSTSIGERFVWLAGKILRSAIVASWLLAAYIGLKLIGVPLPF